MVSALQLCGPPEIHRLPSSSADGGSDEDTDEDTIDPPMGFTENKSLTYLSSGSPCLDFFFHVVPDTPPSDLIKRLTLSWTHNPVTTLKLICHLRGVRGTGKSDKESFYTAALWLHYHHPKTLACNVGVFANFGYFKDLIEILFRILEGSEVRKIAKTEWSNRKKKIKYTKRVDSSSREERRRLKKRKRVSRKERIEANNEKVQEERQSARVMRKEREIAKAKKAYDRYTHDPEYQFLHDKVSGFFAEMLKSDLKYLNSGERNKISLAAKWCPTIDSSYDKSLLICESIARKIFPRDADPQYEGIEENHYVYRVRDRLRKQVLVPLHGVLDLPEVYMSSNQWSSLPYNRVPSVAMKNYKTIFKKHDEKRFEDYLEDVKTGKSKIAAGALLPHEIVASLDDYDGGKVAELQWKRMVDDLAEKGKLKNCLAVCDVSGSMSGTPMNVCVALGLLISELSEDPWKGKVITFSENPQLHEIQGESLLEKTEFVEEMDWGTNTNFQRVFKRILEVAVKGNLSEDQMIKRLFVFSDIEFDEASGNHGCLDAGIRKRKERRGEKGKRKKGWETDYEVIERRFRMKGYKRVPEIVFWNLRQSSSTPVTARQKGVALVSGFSKNMVSMFLEDSGIVTPESVMEKAISGEEYQKLVVYD